MWRGMEERINRLRIGECWMTFKNLLEDGRRVRDWGRTEEQKVLGMDARNRVGMCCGFVHFCALIY
jgi:hypothetical protein